MLFTHSDACIVGSRPQPLLGELQCIVNGVTWRTSMVAEASSTSGSSSRKVYEQQQQQQQQQQPLHFAVQKTDNT